MFFLLGFFFFGDIIARYVYILPYIFYKKQSFIIVLVYVATILPNALCSPFFAASQATAPNGPSLSGGARVMSSNAASNLEISIL